MSTLGAAAQGAAQPFSQMTNIMLEGSQRDQLLEKENSMREEAAKRLAERTGQERTQDRQFAVDDMATRHNNELGLINARKDPLDASLKRAQIKNETAKGDNKNPASWLNVSVKLSGMADEAKAMGDDASAEIYRKQASDAYATAQKLQGVTEKPAQGIDDFFPDKAKPVVAETQGTAKTQGTQAKEAPKAEPAKATEGLDASGNLLPGWKWGNQIRGGSRKPEKMAVTRGGYR